MIKKLTLVSCSLLLSACGSGSQKFETVTVTVGSVSCHENIRIDHSSQAGISYTDVSDGSTVRLNVDSAKRPGADDFVFSKRCQEIVEWAKMAAEGDARRAIANAEEAESRAKLNQAINEEELQSINGTGMELSSKW